MIMTHLPKILLTAIFVIAMGGCLKSPGSDEIPPVPSSIIPKGPPLNNFDLIDQDAQPFSSKSLEGQPWVASFFFTNCPAVCWRLNQALQGWQKDHPESKIKFISITCDPETDKPPALKKYADHFKAEPGRWIFLTGQMPYIERLAADMFKLSVQKGTHSDRAVVVDRGGVVRGYFRVTEPEEFKKLAKLLDEIEKERPPAVKAEKSEVEPEKSES
jgi:cytochrome oxidase Cu insertion factor (SCO1/SenC/PrrC family)